MRFFLRTSRVTVKFVSILIALGIAVSFLLKAEPVMSSNGIQLPPRIVSTPTPSPVLRPQVRTRKYSEFPHSQKAHQMACNSCHKFPSDNWKKVRTDDAAFPDITDYPKHDSCISCINSSFLVGGHRRFARYVTRTPAQEIAADILFQIQERSLTSLQKAKSPIPIFR